MADKEGKNPRPVEGFGWEQFEKSLQERFAPPPEGALSARQLADKFHAPLKAMGDELRRRVRAGQMESKMYKQQMYYWPKVAK